MRRDRTFHLSCYVTLALAAICLGFAEVFFLKWMFWYLGFLGVFVFLAWKNEGRWQLSEQGANTVGLFIAFGMLGWIVLQLPRNEEELLAAGVPWPAGLLPHLGPLLMILTVVKLFRPKKIADFWALQILGVMMVTLASVLAGDVDHTIWVLLYLVSLIWCLTLFQRMQATWTGLSEVSRRDVPLFETRLADESRSASFVHDFAPACGWSIAVVALGTTLFVCAPRHANVQWIPHKLTASASGRMSTGMEAGMDLNRIGKIELSDEIAFEVTAQNARGQQVDLPLDLYWRGEVLDFYQNGRWYPGSQAADAMADILGQDGSNDPLRSKLLSVPKYYEPITPEKLPDELPEGKTYLTIHVLTGAAGHLALAEPIDIRYDIGRAPQIGDRPSRSSLFIYLEGADTIVPPHQARRAAYRYGQVVDFTADPKVQPARPILPRYLRSYLEQSPPVEILNWSRELLARLDTLTPEERALDAEGRIAPRHRAKVAQAITRYFSLSGEYLYSLNLRRVDASKDPNVDFLLNVKEGHCERYASGLALTLRGLGIPARVIHGFRGSEKTEDGQTVVRFNQAHSWVQALVPDASAKPVAPKPAAAPADESEADVDGENLPPVDGAAPQPKASAAPSQWLLLDPTPSQEAPLDRWQLFYEWLDTALRAARSAFRTAVLDYGSDQQKSRLRGIWMWLMSPAGRIPLALIALLIATPLVKRFALPHALAWWRSRQESRLAKSRLPWLSEALDLIASKTGRRPMRSETLLEFAARLDDQFHPFTTVADAANRARFSSAPLTAADAAAVANSLAELRNSSAIETPAIG